jgi:hypothetical protein
MPAYLSQYRKAGAGNHTKKRDQRRNLRGAAAAYYLFRGIDLFY